MRACLCTEIHVTKDCSSFSLRWVCNTCQYVISSFHFGVCMIIWLLRPGIIFFFNVMLCISPPGRVPWELLASREHVFPSGTTASQARWGHADWWYGRGGTLWGGPWIPEEEVQWRSIWRRWGSKKPWSTVPDSVKLLFSASINAAPFLCKFDNRIVKFVSAPPIWLFTG